jgi:hypothetical protein
MYPGLGFSELRLMFGFKSHTAPLEPVVSATQNQIRRLSRRGVSLTSLPGIRVASRLCLTWEPACVSVAELSDTTLDFTLIVPTNMTCHFKRQVQVRLPLFGFCISLPIWISLMLLIISLFGLPLCAFLYGVGYR